MVTLQYNNTFLLFEGKELLEGEYWFWFGVRFADGNIVYNQNIPGHFTVQP